MARKTKATALNFKAMPQRDVPQGRNGKHKQIVTKILSDLDQIPAGVALKIPLAQLADGKESALGVESCDAKARVCRRDGERLDLLVRVE
jgi:hypothetical protein